MNLIKDFFVLSLLLKMEPQMDEKQSWETHTPWLQNLSQRYSNQNSLGTGIRLAKEINRIKLRVHSIVSWFPIKCAKTILLGENSLFNKWWQDNWISTCKDMNLDHSVQFSSVAQSCPTLCDPMNHSTPGLPVHHHLPEFTQTHVHRVGDAIQPSHPLSSPSPPAPNPSQHQSLFQWINSLHEVAKVLEFQL